jgi:hypothetical protein
MAWETETKPKNPRKARKAKSLQASKLSEALNFICLRVEPGWINAVPGAFAHGGELDRRDGRRDLRRASD